jgi:hypothetical protein
MEKLYVNEIGPGGEVSTVGLFYSRAEAERIIAKLQSMPDKAECRYDIVEAMTGSAPTHSPEPKGSSGRE